MSRPPKFPTPPVCDHPERPDGKPLCHACWAAFKPQFDAWAEEWKRQRRERDPKTGARYCLMCGGRSDDFPLCQSCFDATDELVCQSDECIHCGDEPRHLLDDEEVKWTAHGDALCSECDGMRDVTSATACCMRVT